MNKKYALIITFLIVLIAFNLISIIVLFSSSKSHETLIIARVIDGDTIETTDGKIVRLADINAPEKGTAGADEARVFLQAYENQTLKADILGEDVYQRLLVQLYAPDYLNLELVKQGYVSKFLVGEGEEKTFAEAELEAIAAQRGIWKNSPYKDCIIAVIDAQQEVLTLGNICPDLSVIGWRLKDESRATYTFSNTFIKTIRLHSGKGDDNDTDIFWGKDNIWNNERDTLYLFDHESKLVLHKSYGY